MNKQTTQSLAQMIHIASVAGCANFTFAQNGGMIFADRVNPQTNKRQVLVLNAGVSSKAYEQNCQNLMTVCSNINFDKNSNVPEGKQDDVLFSAIANIRDGGISQEMVDNAKSANKEFRFAMISGENSGAIPLAMALNEGIVNFAANQQAMASEEPVVDAEVELENDGPVMERDFNN